MVLSCVAGCGCTLVNSSLVKQDGQVEKLHCFFFAGYLKLNCLASTNSLRFSSMQPSNQGANHGIKLRMCGRSDEDQRRVEKAMAYAKVFKEEGVPSDMRMFNVNKVLTCTATALAALHMSLLVISAAFSSCLSQPHLTLCQVARGTDAVLADSRLAKVYMYAKMFNEMPKR
eukprot:499764-Hanusia_phi.AAC.2